VIQIDRRVGSVELAKYFPDELHTVVELEFADFAFSGNGPDGEVRVGIERKQIQDFLDSLKTGRLLGHQVPGMIKLYDYNYLVIEGIFKPYPDYIMVPKGKSWIKLQIGSKVIDPYLATLETLAGFMVRETSSQKRTAQLVLNLFKWWQKDFKEHGQYAPYQKKVQLPKGVTNGAMVYKVARVLPGIGVKKAELVRKKFKTVAEMVNATEKDWTSIQDIGPVKARNIMEAIGVRKKKGK